MTFQVGEILYRKAPSFFERWSTFIQVIEILSDGYARFEVTLDEEVFQEQVSTDYHVDADGLITDIYDRKWHPFPDREINLLKFCEKYHEINDNKSIKNINLIFLLIYFENFHENFLFCYI